MPQVYQRLTRRERHEELIHYAIDGAVEQVQRALRHAGGKGAININVLWEMGGAQRVLEGVLEQTKGWSPASPAARACPTSCPKSPRATTSLSADHQLGAAPSARCGSAPITRWPSCWRRWSTKTRGWRAGTTAFQRRRPAQARGSLSARQGAARHDARGRHLRRRADRDGRRRLDLREWDNWIDNPELGQIAFQFGTRPLLTEESPIPQGWKDALMTLEEGDVLLHHFSPTGFYSSAVRNPFLRELEARSRAADRLHSRVGRASTRQLDVGVEGQEFLGDHAATCCARANGMARASPRRSRRPTTPWSSSPRRTRDDPQGPDGLHGLPVALRVLVVGGPRE